MAVISLARTSAPIQETTQYVRCFRHEGEECPRCDGSRYRPRKYCAGCGEPAGRILEVGKPLVGLVNRRDRTGPFYCLPCHPELGGADGLAKLAQLDEIK